MRRSDLLIVAALAFCGMGAAYWQGNNIVFTGSTVPWSTGSYFDFSEIAAPSNPSAGTRRLFTDSATGELSVRTSAGTTVSLEDAGGGADHDLLSATHLDTTPAAVTRGAVIVGVGATPLWTRVTVGADGTYLGSDGTDTAFRQVAMSQVSGTISTSQHGSLGAIANAHAFSDISGGITAAQHGALGSGASHTTAQPVTVADEGSNVTNTPHTRLNFAGAGVSVADGGSGTATVTISGGAGVASRSVFGPWTKVNVPASGSDLTFDMPTSAILPAGQANIRMPFAGKVVGISASMSAARTQGSATFEVFKNGSALTGTPTCVIDATNTQRTYGASGTGTFVAGDYLDVRVDMAGTYAPTTSESAVYITVEWTN